MPDKQTTERLGEELVKRKDVLLRSLELNEEAWAGLQKRQIELEERGANVNLALNIEGLDEQILQELFRIEEALQKIRNQTYGICDSCGTEINVERLKAIPETARCRKCAAENEPEFEAAAREFEEITGAGLPDELQGLNDEQLANRVREYIEQDERIPSEELRILSKKGVFQLSGYLPDERSREILMQILNDNLGLTDMEDRIVIDRQLWEHRHRTPGRKPPARTDYEEAAEGEGTATSDPTKSQKSGLPLEPADKIVPERK